jgi:hypothetical protein
MEQKTYNGECMWRVLLQVKARESLGQGPSKQVNVLSPSANSQQKQPACSPEPPLLPLKRNWPAQTEKDHVDYLNFNIAIALAPWRNKEIMKTWTTREVTRMLLLKTLPHELHLLTLPCSAHDTFLPGPVHTVMGQVLEIPSGKLVLISTCFQCDYSYKKTDNTMKAIALLQKHNW